MTKKWYGIEMADKMRSYWKVDADDNDDDDEWMKIEDKSLRKFVRNKIKIKIEENDWKSIWNEDFHSGLLLCLCGSDDGLKYRLSIFPVSPSI